MASLIAACAVLIFVAGIFLIWKSFQPRDLTKPRRNWHRPALKSRTRNLALIGLLLGIVAWILTGYVITIILFPVLLAVGPGLFSASAAQNEIERLTAMEEWMRNLAGIMAVGSGLEQAILATGKSIPRPIESELNNLLSRIRSGLPIRDCLDRFANELDDSTGDMIVGMLKLASHIRGSGLPSFLNNAAATVADDVRGRRAAEVARRGPRTEARAVSIIATGFLCGLFFLSDFMAPYKTTAGQTVLIVLLCAFGATLLWMRVITRPSKLERFIGTTDRRNYRGTSAGAHRRNTATVNAEINRKRAAQ